MTPMHTQRHMRTGLKKLSNMKKSRSHTMLRDGFTSIVRSPAFAFATGVVAFLAAMMVVVTIVVYGFSSHLRTAIADKVDMNVYFFPSTDNAIVDDFAAMIKTRPEVAVVDTISKEEALAAFKIRHEHDALTLQALDELNENPLGASVVVRTHEPNQLKTIALLLDGDSESVKAFYPYIERVNYFDHEQIIDRFNGFTQALKKIVVGIVIATFLLVILLMYTMAKVHSVADYEMHETKHLLGADHSAIVAPRMVSHTIIAATGATLAIIASIIIAWQVSGGTASFFEGFRFDSFILQSLGWICAIVYGLLFLCAIGTTLVAYATTTSNR